MTQTVHELGTPTSELRALPDIITIPSINGEMVTLRPATLDDLAFMDSLNAYHGASGITGKDRRAERLAVEAWVRRSIAWQEGRSSAVEGIRDPEARGTIAWSISRRDAAQDSDTDQKTPILGMIFLIDIDGWARSARIQVVLGEEYRGRGYSRDAMPRVMTYGFADSPEGLGLHRIWVGVPEKNTRSISVYQSLGFMQSGTGRDALWDNSLQKYQDLIVMDTIEDEYDPIRSLEAFGMHLVEGNPGFKKATDQHRRTLEQTAALAGSGTLNTATDDSQRDDATQADDKKNGFFSRWRQQPSNDESGEDDDRRVAEELREADTPVAPDGTDGAGAAENGWPYNAAGRSTSKKAWWRTLGEHRSRSSKDNE